MKPFTIIDCVQRSPEWRSARCGRATGSKAAAVLGFLSGGKENAARRDYRLQLVSERLTGEPQESGYANDDMRRGVDLEPAALAAYEALTREFTETTGFLAHADLLAGCSLDAHVGDFDILVSLKCPKTATHLGYLRDQRIPPAYVPQMLHELFITGAQEYHFLSFDDRLIGKLQTCLVRVKRDDAAVYGYAQQLRAFLAEVDVELSALQTMANTADVLTAATGAA
jgi:hypothetical protein